MESALSAVTTMNKIGNIQVQEHFLGLVHECT